MSRLSGRRRATLTFDEDTHKYYDGDVELPSVTHITRFCSYDSVNGNGSNPYYRERGTKVHELTADYDLTGEFPEGTGLDGYLMAYSHFCRDYRPKWDYIERQLGSAEKGFAGTADRIGYIDEQLTILDIKTASRPSKLALTAQLTGYAILLGSWDIKLYGLKLSNTGHYQLIPINYDGTLFNACWALNEASRRLK